MAENLVDSLTVITGLVAAFGGWYAAIGASKSASAAQAAVSIAAVAQNRALRVQLIISSGEVTTEAQIVNFLISTLKSEYQSLFTFSGSIQHSSHKLLKQGLEDRDLAITTIISSTSALLDKFKSLNNASEEDIASQFLETQKALLEIRRHKIELELELGRIIQQNGEFRQRTLNK
jgi:hypothetical protein